MISVLVTFSDSFTFGSTFHSLTYQRNLLYCAFLYMKYCLGYTPVLKSEAKRA